MKTTGQFIKRALPLLLLLSILLCTACSRYTPPQTFLTGELSAEPSDLDPKLSLLKKAMLADFGGSNVYKKLKASKPDDGRYTVFISLSDSVSAAKVVNANGDSISDAFEKAADKIRSYVDGSGTAPVWVKADLVTSSENVISTRLESLIQKCKKNCFKWGISFDKNFEKAFLESQLNAEGMVLNSDKTLSRAAINASLERDGKEGVSELPLYFVFFYCNGYICDESGSVFALESRIDEGYGKRITGRITPDYAKSVIYSGSSYLTHEVDEDGKFVYGYLASTDTPLDDYNSVRHSGTIWNMIRDYEITGNTELIAPIERAINYMLEHYVCDIGEGRALCRSNETDTLTLGGSALSLCALAEYTRVFESDRYIENARALANGIVYLHTLSDGGYYHLLQHPGLEVLKDFSSVYYDGEATLALTLMYAADKNEKWLNTACEALHHFAANGYEEYHDHWIAYSCNEVTKYVEQPDFYELGLKNVSLAMENERDDTTIHPTGFEMLTASFEMCMRLENSPIRDQVTVPEGFSVKTLAEIVLYRAEYNFYGFGYPEYVMYFSEPAKYLGTFFIRESKYRVRIDDVQHILGGYYNYCAIYDDLVKTAK